MNLSSFFKGSYKFGSFGPLLWPCYLAHCLLCLALTIQWWWFPISKAWYWVRYKCWNMSPGTSNKWSPSAKSTLSFCDRANTPFEFQVLFAASWMNEKAQTLIQNSSKDMCSNCSCSLGNNIHWPPILKYLVKWTIFSNRVLIQTARFKNPWMTRTPLKAKIFELF